MGRKTVTKIIGTTNKSFAIVIIVPISAFVRKFLVLLCFISVKGMKRACEYTSNSICINRIKGVDRLAPGLNAIQQVSTPRQAYNILKSSLFNVLLDSVQESNNFF